MRKENRRYFFLVTYGALLVFDKITKRKIIDLQSTTQSLGQVFFLILAGKLLNSLIR
jgi:hypothetical protein